MAKVVNDDAEDIAETKAGHPPTAAEEAKEDKGKGKKKKMSGKNYNFNVVNTAAAMKGGK